MGSCWMRLGYIREGVAAARWGVLKLLKTQSGILCGHDSPFCRFPDSHHSNFHQQNAIIVSLSRKSFCLRLKNFRRMSEVLFVKRIV